MENHNSNNIEHFFSLNECSSMGKIVYDKRFYEIVGINQKRWGMLRRQEVPILMSECVSLAQYLGISIMEFIDSTIQHSSTPSASIHPLKIIGIEDCCEKKSGIVFGQPKNPYLSTKYNHSMRLSFNDTRGASLEEIDIIFDPEELKEFASSIISILS